MCVTVYVGTVRVTQCICRIAMVLGSIAGVLLGIFSEG